MKRVRSQDDSGSKNFNLEHRMKRKKCDDDVKRSGGSQMSSTGDDRKTTRTSIDFLRRT